MIDHLVGRPNPSWKRTQVFLVIFFWLWRILRGNSRPPRILWFKKANRILYRYTPWQIIVSTLTALYAVRNFDKLLGLGSPEPLARLYSPSYYRATWINTGLEAGFATAMSIRPKWLRDICSIVFSGYYILYANEGDEKLRRFRAVPTVEMLRTTWEKTTNPYIRLITHLPAVSMRRKILLPRPKSSQYKRPITAYFFYHPHESQLRHTTDLILDFPGGGFVAMTPEHHEERLRLWAITTGKPILSIEYGKAPEYPYPFAIDEAFDTYKVLVESVGTLIGMSGKKLNIIITGDSAGATLAINIIFKILELDQSTQPPVDLKLPQPVALVLNYAALDFNFTSWMSPANLRVLQSEQSSGNLPGLNELAAQKDHLQHISPLSMVKDNRFGAHRGKRLKRKGSWKDTIRGFASSGEKEKESSSGRYSTSAVKTPRRHSTFLRQREQDVTDGEGELADAESDEDDDEDLDDRREEDRPIRARVRYEYPDFPIPSAVNLSSSGLERQQEELSAALEEADSRASKAVGANVLGKEPIGTRLTMTSRTGYFQDRIVSPSMMRAMAILYIGPHRNPDFATDFHLSPILAPAHLLAQFPPLLMQCGEKDPFVDDTVIFAGRVREAKRARKHELELAISGKSARFGENLRMSGIDASLGGGSIAAMKKERDKLVKETEDDWVQMVLFSDWSHGYLQMPTLMSEARAVIEELAEWMDDAFERNSQRAAAHDHWHTGNGKAKDTTCLPPSSTVTSSETETDDTGITFIPKRYQNGTSGFEDDLRKANVSKPVAVRSSKGGSSDESEAQLSDRTVSPSLAPSEQEKHRDVLGLLEAEYSTVAQRSPQPPGTPKTGGPRQAGTQITETELMRRRRLLDSHIFEHKV
ncbi:Hormone-sensitive lipase [Hypsizygus marmoreus]|uniref:Hormone-sensitive lipase n=1 Tax=Hypsizygus marmoreus TaxID=39966 RepID=A0A369K0P0_HYPMA|nr:Hormone-sensitive lipase [Hypsizygus marmoreus]